MEIFVQEIQEVPVSPLDWATAIRCRQARLDLFCSSLLTKHGGESQFSLGHGFG